MNKQIDEILENKSFIHISCGIDADPADGFGRCTCGVKEGLKETADQVSALIVSELEELKEHRVTVKDTDLAEARDWFEAVDVEVINERIKYWRGDA